jgi:sugar phosphate permease
MLHMATAFSIKEPFGDCFSRKLSNYRLLLFVTISATYFLSYFHRAAPAVVGPVLMEEFGLSPSDLGLIGSMYFWAYAATALPAGVLSDTWGARKTIALFVLFAGVGGFAFALGQNAAWLAIGRCIIGLGVGVVYVAAMRILSDWYKPDDLATYSGILLAVGNIGALVSTAPLVFVMDRIGWRNAFSLVSALTIVAGIVSYVVIRNKPSELLPGACTKDIRIDAPRTTNLSSTLAVKTVLGNANFYILGLLLFSYYGTFMGVGSLWAGPYLQHTYGMTKQAAGNILMMFPLGMAIGCPLAGYLSDKVVRSRKRILSVGCLLHLTCYVPLLFWTRTMSEPVLYGLFFWYGLSGGAFVSCFACAKEIFENSFAGTAVGALNIFLFAGGAFYQNVLGATISRHPMVAPGVYPPTAYRTAFFIPAGGLLLGLVAFSFFKERRVG